MVGSKRKSDTVRDFLSEFWPDANDSEVDLLLCQFTGETFEDFVLSSGKTPDEITEVLKAYDKLIGKVAKTKGKKASGKGGKSEV